MRVLQLLVSVCFAYYLNRYYEEPRSVNRLREVSVSHVVEMGTITLISGQFQAGTCHVQRVAQIVNEVETPEAITALDGIPFTVSGYPENPKEKMLLIEMSRHIEAMAWQAGEGHLATGFQRLSRPEDELGTEQVYTQLGSATDVETHVYGVPDAEPSLPGVTVHGIDTDEIRRSWFVAYQSTHHPHEAAALVAIQTAKNTWKGSWTYDPGRVEDLLAYLE